MTLLQQAPHRLTPKPEEAARELGLRQTRKPKEAGQMLGLGERSVYALIRSGQLRSIKVGRKILIPLSAIEEFLNGGEK
ncbi:helix-turn-helix domain-containing protein [Deinococcus sp. NW-56]|uniref:helix-turn-helix domain-containing protein n=1 Tax=Deinococcus sp. NW-56 TaxID=2080419 RepID=UPI000CF446CB|nr:helix-turn-helix domain-containing protein [Deinococcus sp. NW-56]